MRITTIIRTVFTTIFLILASLLVTIPVHADQICGICPPGTILAGRPPEFGTNVPGQQCQDLPVGSPNALYCSFNSSGQCTDPAPQQPPACVFPPTPTPPPNAPPIVASIPGERIPVGGTYSSDGHFVATVTFSDPDSTSWTQTVNYGDGSGTQTLVGNGLNHMYTTAGVYTITVSVTDNQGATGVRTTTVLVGNICAVCPLGTPLAGKPAEFGTHIPGQQCQDLQPTDPNGIYCNFNSAGDCTQSVNTPPFCPAPVIGQIPSMTLNEGDLYGFTGSFTDDDPNASGWTATVDYGDGSGVQPLNLNGKTFALSHEYVEEGTYTITVTVSGLGEQSTTKTAAVTVNNAPFIIGDITAIANPIQANTSTTLFASFTDPGILDTHTAVWDWGDGTTSNGTVTEANGSGSVTDMHTYTTAGVYSVILTITDDDGMSNASQVFYVVVYDPSAGFMTASGKIISPLGADVALPNVTGDAKFGVQAKYTGGNTIPTGNTKFNFKNGNIDFNSTLYDWLVVSGNKAYLHGTGTVNGTGSYNFLVTVIDGNPDTLRMKIKDNATNTVIYDNQMNAGDFTDPTEAIDSGQIKIH